MSFIHVLKPGLLSTIQDGGRTGYQQYGMVVGGAMDVFALSVANLLVGNQPLEAAIEITLMGPALQFNADTIIAISGGDLGPTIDGVDIPNWHRVIVKKDCTLTFKGCRSGCRAYIAVAGGFAIDPVFGSKSTYLRAKLGGFHGRALAKDDHLPLHNTVVSIGNASRNIAPWSIDHLALAIYTDTPTIRVTRGLQYNWFTADSIAAFFKEPYKLLPQSDRMGYRLSGPALALQAAQSMLSEAVSFGSIQVPGDGQPIVLLADRQTVGGYPKIAQVVTVDLPFLAQAKPGDTLCFKEISLEDAQALLIERAELVEQIKQYVNHRSQ